MAEVSQIAASPIPPHSIATASIDDKGRMKLPTEFTAYWKAIGVSNVFITTMDLQLARVYPISVWEENEKLAEQNTTNPERAERMMMRAKALGGDDEVDSSGRVLLPAELRKRLGLEKQQVHVEMQRNGCVNVMSKKVFEERFSASLVDGAEDWKAVRREGWK